jgi:HipA-like kinase
MPRTVIATRYVTPLREGGSLPGLVEADDDGLYVVKFRGAGQGPKALIAELVVGELAGVAGFCVPERVLVEIDPELGRAEPDPEVNDLITSSGGVNFGLDFLPGALEYKPGSVDATFAAELVWFDALMTNVDRTPRNPNLIAWYGRTWLIDHGAALYQHHGDTPLVERAREPFPLIAEHVLLGPAGPIGAADDRLAPRLTEAAIDEVLRSVPDEWLGDDPARARSSYLEYLHRRLEPPRIFADEAERARGA